MSNNINTFSDEQIIFTQKLAGMLMSKGFVLKRIDKSNKDKNKNIFIFNKSEELLKYIKQYKNV